MFGVMLWVRNGVATIPSTLIIRSSDTEYVDQCVALTPSGFVSPEQAPLVGGVEKINLKHEESIVSLLLPPGLVGGLRGRNPLLVVSSVTPGGFIPPISLVGFLFIMHCIICIVSCFPIHLKISKPFKIFNHVSMFSQNNPTNSKSFSLFLST